MAINKRLLAKRDMNFFAEFTANAAKMRRMFGYAVVIGVIVVGVLLAIVGYDLVRNALIKAEITSLELILNSEEYAHLEERAQELARELEEKQNIYYALTQMRKQVDTTNSAPVDLPDILKASIPSDTYVEHYAITSNEAAISGASFSYYSVVDMVHKLNESDVFTTVPKLHIATVDPTSIAGVSDFIQTKPSADGKTSVTTFNLIDNYYQFEIQGTLLGEVYISIGRYANGDVATSLSGIETIPVKIGNPYEIADVATYTTGGITYNLAKITVNGIAADQNSVDGAKANNKIAGTAYNNIEIGLYYDKPVETTESSEGGEGK
ncbi:MAG: PilN domain-containing protein [Clostridiales bacterium]|nr:PilN domain-containing protein [Clostridiales bacterium]